MSAIRISVAGAAGRMGRAVLQAALDQHELEIASALVIAGDPWVGRDLGVCLGRLPMGRTVATDPELAFAGAGVVIDFTAPRSTLSFLPILTRLKVPLVCGTTGLNDAERAQLVEASAQLPIVWAANYSLGVNVLLALVEQAATLLGEGYDLECLELHHRFKKDSPSGTALALLEAGLKPRGRSVYDALTVRGHGMTGPRGGGGEAGAAALRGGDVVGEHRVFFLGSGERLELTHQATDRQGFARGALRAAEWVVSQPPGLYSMMDVLGLKKV